MDDDVTIDKVTNIHSGESSRNNEDEIDSSFINNQHEEDNQTFSILDKVYDIGDVLMAMLKMCETRFRQWMII